MRIYYATMMLALTLSSVSMPCLADGNEESVSGNSVAQVEGFRQGGSENGKESMLSSRTDRGSSAASAATSEASPFRNAFYPGLSFLGGSRSSTSNYVKSTREPSNFVKSDSDF
jgi:hypothetical protein